MKSLFAYGSLMDPDIFLLVTGECHQSTPALITGFERFSVIGESYPAVVRNEQGIVEGVIYRDLNDRVFEQLDSFEGDEYHRVTIAVGSGNERAELYLYRDSWSEKISAEPWSYEQFILYEKPRFIQLCHDSSCQNTRNSE